MAVRNAHRALGGSAYILHNPFLGADSVAILQLMLGEIDFGDYTTFLNLADSLFNLGSGSGHSPRFGAVERLPGLFYGGRQRGKDGKCARCGRWDDWRLPETAAHFKLRRGGPAIYQISVHIVFYLFVVGYRYEPKYASKMCFATLNPSNVRM